MNPKINYEKIVFTSDFHSNLPEGISFIEKLFEFKSQKTLIIDLGDFSDGNSFYEFSKGKTEKILLKKLFNVLIPGNHGFKEILNLTKSSIIINCNIWKSGQKLFKESKIFSVNGYKIGIIGVTSKEAFESIPINDRLGLKVKNPVKTVINVLNKIKSNTDYIILCSHSGLKFDQNNFSNNSDIDCILSSHCHSLGNRFGNKNQIICQTNDNGKSIGIIKFLIKV